MHLKGCGIINIHWKNKKHFSSYKVAKMFVLLCVILMGGMKYSKTNTEKSTAMQILFPLETPVTQKSTTAFSNLEGELINAGCPLYLHIFLYLCTLRVHFLQYMDVYCISSLIFDLFKQLKPFICHPLLFLWIGISQEDWRVGSDLKLL